MTMGLLIKETMSGWLTLDEAPARRPFRFSIQAFTPRIFSLSTPRFFRGRVELDGEPYACEGELTLHLGGPHYWLRFEHPVLGTLRAEGRKRYGHGGWIQSLVTCPLTVFRDGREVGRASVAYRDSMLLFPFKALRLVDEQRAYQGATP
ncbi:MAG: hypothetical protein CL549_03935 [Alcanivorax sp.]|nr:hypothetical protein [Alcanivorax sp.]MAY09634.1 hypothetical protein [Alcanivorax sp.]MBM1145746.1 hypothetical protein [Alcanivorax sp. ZXX171]HCE41539.1 hypothetical protein [Alcanivorax sp.]|tara:strand:+ start:130 stop:576 length:447 start_codon:yes stop_codon:yes gene_type:complete